MMDRARISAVRALFIRSMMMSAFVLVAGAASMRAATLCVAEHGHSSCYSSISAALAAASAGDTVQVGPGTYAEDVTITKSISLVGQNSASTIIDATGKSNGIYVDGFHAPGLTGVVVRGFTVENANYEGMLIQNASDVTISGNTVRLNDRDEVNGTGCAGLPPFETNEADDCGEGIHLMGVDHSTVADNTVEHNSGGILVSDETAANHDNVITRNTVRDNAYDCGITLASHAAFMPNATNTHAYGVWHNTVSSNLSRHNGFGGPGGGAGVGVFAAGPWQVAIYNTVINNRLIDNSHPGVSVHTHAFLTFPGHPPNPNANDNAIIGNYISGNGPDDSVGTTASTGIGVLGATPITGLVISGNVIEDESIDVAFKSASAMQLHLNNLSGNGIGVQNLNAAGTVDATENWWGCSGGPAANGCSTVSGPNVTWIPWLTTPIEAH